MKKIFAIIMMLLFVICLSACSLQTQQQKTLEIVVVPTCWSDELNEQIEAHVEQRPELNVYQNSSETPDARYQALLVEDLVAQEVDAICLQMVDETVMEMVQKAEDAGVLVLTGDDVIAMIDEAAMLLQKQS